MKSFLFNRVLTATFVTVLAVFLSGCKDKPQSDEILQKTETAAEKTGDAIKTGAEKTGEAINTGAQKTEDAIETAVSKTGEAIKTGATKVEEAVK